MTGAGPVAPVLDQLWQRRGEAQIAVQLLEGYRRQIQEDASALENPQAVLDYIDFFSTMAGETERECARVSAELEHGASETLIQALRDLANRGAVEQLRCLGFRDKWINKPLPQERMRPLLNDISVATRDLLATCRDVQSSAHALERAMAPEAPQTREARSFDRRALFTRLFKP